MCLWLGCRARPTQRWALLRALAVGSLFIGIETRGRQARRGQSRALRTVEQPGVQPRPFHIGHTKPEGRLVEPEQLAHGTKGAAVHEHRFDLRREVMQRWGLEGTHLSGLDETCPCIGAERKLCVWMQDIRLDSCCP